MTPTSPTTSASRATPEGTQHTRAAGSAHATGAQAEPCSVAAEEPLPAVPAPALAQALPLAAWGDWRWQMAHRLTGPDALGRHLTLSSTERAAFTASGPPLPRVSITPYYLSLMAPTDPACPVRQQALPHPEDRVAAPAESADPLGERPRSPVPGLVHRYPDRVVLLVALDCPVRCRHCNRRARSPAEFCCSAGAKGHAVDWLRAHPQVREAILSGGDPLTLSDDALGGWLEALGDVGHLETLRIHTRAPVTCPMRVTPALVTLLGAASRRTPLYVVTQFNHPREVTPEAVAACARLADAGIPLANQSVLLRGINSNAEVLLTLSRALLRARVRPYYLFQLDPVVGTERFKTPVRAGMDLVASLRGRLSGLGIPTFVLDAPGGHGKVALMPDRILSAGQGRITVRTPLGGEVDYPDTGSPDLSCPPAPRAG